MPRRALAEHRPYLLLGLLASITYYFAADEAIGGIWLMLWKGLGVASLALYAVHRGRGVDGLLISAVLALSALGDVALEISYVGGGILHGIGHVIGIVLFWRNRREGARASQKFAGLALLILTPAIVAALTYPLANWTLSGVYAVLLGAMAAAAWTSRFPRYRVGIGAVLVATGHILIFTREAGPLAGDTANLLIWPIYFAGQFLIATGVVQTLRQSPAQAD